MPNYTNAVTANQDAPQQSPTFKQFLQRARSRTERLRFACLIIHGFADQIDSDDGVDVTVLDGCDEIDIENLMADGLIRVSYPSWIGGERMHETDWVDTYRPGDFTARDDDGNENPAIIRLTAEGRKVAREFGDLDFSGKGDVGRLVPWSDGDTNFAAAKQLIELPTFEGKLSLSTLGRRLKRSDCPVRFMSRVTGNTKLRVHLGDALNPVGAAFLLSSCSTANTDPTGVEIDQATKQIRDNRNPNFDRES